MAKTWRQPSLPIVLADARDPLTPLEFPEEPARCIPPSSGRAGSAGSGIGLERAPWAHRCIPIPGSRIETRQVRKTRDAVPASLSRQYSQGLTGRRISGSSKATSQAGSFPLIESAEPTDSGLRGPPGSPIPRQQDVEGTCGVEMPFERDVVGGGFLHLARVAVAGVDRVRDQARRLGVADAAQRADAGIGPVPLAPEQPLVQVVVGQTCRNSDHRIARQYAALRGPYVFDRELRTCELHDVLRNHHVDPEPSHALANVPVVERVLAPRCDDVVRCEQGDFTTLPVQEL